MLACTTCLLPSSRCFSLASHCCCSCAAGPSGRALLGRLFQQHRDKRAAAGGDGCCQGRPASSPTWTMSPPARAPSPAPASPCPATPPAPGSRQTAVSATPPGRCTRPAASARPGPLGSHAAPTPATRLLDELGHLLLVLGAQVHQPTWPAGLAGLNGRRHHQRRGLVSAVHVRIEIVPLAASCAPLRASWRGRPSSAPCRPACPTASS